MKTIALLLFLVVMISCNDSMVNVSVNNTPRPYIEQSKTIPIAGVNEVEITGASTAKIVAGEWHFIVTGDSTDLADLRISSSDGKFSYGFSKHENHRYGLKWSIALPTLKAVRIAGASQVVLSDFQNADFLVNVSEASTLDAYAMSTRHTTLDVSGASTAKINVSETLDAKIAGASKVFYRGNPTTKTAITGSSTIKQD